MNQSAFNFTERPPADPVAQAIAAIRLDPLGFKSVTEGWLQSNKQVWLTFHRMSETLRRLGRHRGAKCIYETMRYETAIADAEITFKLNNSYVSGLARLYNVVSGSDFFETRETTL